LRELITDGEKVYNNKSPSALSSSSQKFTCVAVCSATFKVLNIDGVMIVSQEGVNWREEGAGMRTDLAGTGWSRRERGEDGDRIRSRAHLWYATENPPKPFKVPIYGKEDLGLS
jgi:hypothetical protein